MKRCGRVLASLVAISFFNGTARAQSSLDILGKELDQVKEQHQRTTQQHFTQFLDTLAGAASSPDAAIQLYRVAGGALPPPTEVQTRHEHETPDERAARLAKDRAALASFGNMLQLHCGLMRFAGRFVDQPNDPNLQKDWIEWLKVAAQIYPQVDGAPDIKGLEMEKSIISVYLKFDDWDDKDQGKWSVQDVPKFYFTNVLQPLRNPLTPAALPAWDAYIAMKNADEPDTNKWNQVEYPALLFQKDTDDFNLAPNTDKLQTLVGLIKANANHPQVDKWIAQVRDMMKDYRDQRTAVTSGSTPGAPAPDFVPPDNPDAPPAVATPVAPTPPPEPPPAK